MKHPDKSLMGLGSAIREAQDTLPVQVVDDIDQRLLQRLLHVRPLPSRPFRRALVPSLAFAALAVIAAGMLRPRLLSFRIADHRGTTGAWIAPERSNVPLDFSDGSHIVLEKAAQARVEQIDSSGARISLERGRAEANIVHRRASRWSLLAGPFTVAVLGTHFSIDWDPLSQQLELTLHEGTVTLSGPVVGDARRVQQGETLTVFAREGRMEVRYASAFGSEAAPEPDSQSNAGAALVPAEAPRPAPSRTRLANHSPPESGAHPAQGASPRWRLLALANRSEEAVSAAAATGFDSICRTADASDLRLLGDTARLAGKPELARRAFESMRARFARSDEAAVASFLLGKLYFDNLKSYRDAADWFSVYLAERPAGPLAREAAGRLIEARRKSGDDSGARDAAHNYLARYPHGPHATLARGVAGE